MSIFSSWDAAPNSGVITYRETSQNGTMLTSPCPIPGVSTTTRSNPAAWQAAMMSPRCSGTCAAGGTCRQRPEENLVAVADIEGVHPDPVAEQRAAAPAPGRVDRDLGHSQLVLAVQPESAQQFVRQGRLAGPAGAGDAEDGDSGPPRCLAQDLGEPGIAAGLEHGDGPGERHRVTGQHGVRGGRRDGQVDIAGGDHLVDHAGQAEPLAVRRGEDLHAPLGEQRDLLRDDHAAATAEDLDVPGTALGEPLA